MHRFLIEIPHQNQKKECLQAVNIFKSTGSHFLTHADWGCSDDIHKAWIIMEAPTKAAALNIVPPWYRSQATVVTLQKLALDDINQDLEKHQD
jgi:hypothetical protein